MRRKRYDSPALVLNEIGSLIFFVHDEWMMHMEDENVKAPPAWKKTVSIPTRLADQMKAQWEAEGWTVRTGLFHTQFPNQEEEVHMRLENRDLKAAVDDYTRRRIRWEFDWLSSKNTEAAAAYITNHLNPYEKECIAAETFDLIPCLAEGGQCDMNCLYFEGRCVK